MEAGIAKLDDGAIEIVGDATYAERALRCREGNVLRPFATCRERVLVKDRFELPR